MIKIVKKLRANIAGIQNIVSTRSTASIVNIVSTVNTASIKGNDLTFYIFKLKLRRILINRFFKIWLLIYTT